MPRLNTITFIRTSLANLNAQAGANGLIQGEPYLITDQNRIAVALSTSTYQTYALASEVGGGPGGSATFTTVEVNLGSVPRRAGKFTIASSGLVTGKPVHIVQAVGPYTGKGTLADEAEMDQVSCSASVTSSTQITVYWQSSGPVMGNRKFDYLISA